MYSLNLGAKGLNEHIYASLPVCYDGKFILVRVVAWANQFNQFLPCMFIQNKILQINLRKEKNPQHFSSVLSLFKGKTCEVYLTIIRRSGGEWRWIFTKPLRRGKYPPLFTDTKWKICFSIYNTSSIAIPKKVLYFPMKWVSRDILFTRKLPGGE